MDLPEESIKQRTIHSSWYIIVKSTDIQAHQNVSLITLKVEHPPGMNRQLLPS